MASLKNNYKYNNIGYISVENFIDPKLGQGRVKEGDYEQVARQF